MMNICYITDEKYAMPTCVSITSLISHHLDTEMKIYVLCDDIRAESQGRFLETSDMFHHVELIEVKNGRYEDIAEETYKQNGTYVSKSALFKFDIPNILPEINRILYLDGDTIINGDLQKIFSIDMKGHYIAAANDMGINFAIKVRGEDYAKRVGIEFNNYFNSGVMLLNLEEMRNDSMSDRLMEYRCNGQNYFMDQDALNVCMGMKRISLPYQYNFRTPIINEMAFDEINETFFDRKYKTITECIENQTILHMTDRHKPWEYQTDYFSEIFLSYYQQSPYRDMEIEMKSLEYALTKEKEELIRNCQELNQIIEGHINTINELYEKIEMMDWHFPYDAIPKGSKVILFGAGEVGREYKRINDYTQYCNIVLWVDSNSDLWGDEIKSPESIKDTECDYVILANSHIEVLHSMQRIVGKIGFTGKMVTTR